MFLGLVPTLNLASSILEVEGPSNRLEDRFGVVAGIFSNPGGSLSGAVKVNLTDFFRVFGGGGQNFFPCSSTFLGGGGEFLFPGMNFSPSLSGSLGHVWRNCSDWDSGKKNKDKGLYGSVSMGGDWQAKSGFNVGFGGLMVSPSYFGTKKVFFLPYLNVGYFF